MAWLINKGQSNENRTTATKWQGNLFYSKVIARNVNTFFPLEDETINSSFVERGKSLMDPQPHPLFHFPVRMKPMRRPRMSFFRSQKMWKSRGKIWTARRMLKCFPAKSPKLIPHQIGSQTAFQGVLTSWRVAALSATKKRTTPLCSYLIASISNADEHILHYAHFQSNNKTTVRKKLVDDKTRYGVSKVWTVHFRS